MVPGKIANLKKHEKMAKISKKWQNNFEKMAKKSKNGKNFETTIRKK